MLKISGPNEMYPGKIEKTTRRPTTKRVIKKGTRCFEGRSLAEICQGDDKRIAFDVMTLGDMIEIF